ncbi:MAG: TfoX/Sxy family DNA transformation protein [Myxococcota bacterium]
MPKRDRPVAELTNIGPTIARRLRKVGIETRGDLDRVGPAKVFQRVCAEYPRETISVCYYLYSLEGALRDRHWDAIGAKQKARLREEAGID